MKHRHKPTDELREAMQRALAAPTVDTARGTRRNPLAAIEEVGRTGAFGALIAGWAAVGDVLTFYQERIADESALSHATELLSAYAIARGVGYSPRPALSASTYLAFGVGVPSTGAEVLIVKGTAVGNIPAETHLPAIFETSADLIARKAWNAIDATPDDAPAEPRLVPGAIRIVLAGTQPTTPGDAIVVRCGTAGAPVDFAAIIAAATSDPNRDRTLVRWSIPFANAAERAVADVLVLEQRVRLFGALAPPFASAPLAERRKYALGGFVERDAGVWRRRNDGLDVSPFVLAPLRDGWCGITPTSFVRRQGDESWTTALPAPGATLQSLAVSPAGRIAVGTTAGEVFVSSDDGDVWLRIGGDPASRATRRLPVVPIRGVAIDESGEVPDVYVATDRGVACIPLNGDAWEWRNDGFPGTDARTGYAACSVSSIVIDGATGTLLVTTTYGAYASFDGDSWSRIEGLGSVTKIDALANARFVACGPGGVFLSVDGAVTWAKAIEPDAVPRALAATGATIAVVAGSDVYTTDDGGSSWMRTRDLSPSRIASVAVDRDGRIGAASPLLDDAPDDWPGLADPLKGTTIVLDRSVNLVPGDVVAIARDGRDATCAAYRVVAVATRMLAEYGMSTLGTVVELDVPIVGGPTRRDAIVYVGARRRTALTVRLGARAPFVDRIPVARSVPRLPTGRPAFVEGRAPQALVRGVAARAFTLRFAPDGSPSITESPADSTSPDRDVAGVTRVGARGAAVARFDGISTCEDVFAETAAWRHMPKPPGPAADVASFADELYALVDGDVLVFRDNAWHAGGTHGAVRRLLTLSDDGGVPVALLACLARGAFVRTRRDGLWEPMPGLGDVEVFAVAAGAGVVAAGTSGGLFRRGADGGWTRDERLVRRAVASVAVDPVAGTVYAGTAGAGVWLAPANGGPWEQAFPGEQRGFVDHLALIALPGATTPLVLSGEVGRGVFLGATQLAVGLASALAGMLVATDANGRPVVVVFRATPVIGDEAPATLRRWITALDDDRAETEFLDAGMMTGGFRDRLATELGIRLDRFDVAVEAQGRGWRLTAGDDMPVLLIRRGAHERLNIFDVQRVDMRALPSPLDGRSVTASRADDPVLVWRVAIGDGPTQTLYARESEMWYAPARAAGPAFVERVVAANHLPGAVILQAPLTLAFDPTTTTVLANVVHATHGATTAADEAILSGDPGRPSQTARLTRKPLTHLVADGETRPHPQISVWVRSDQQAAAQQPGTPWAYTDRLLEHGPHDRVFTIDHAVDDAAIVRFGDGVNGALLPRGTENVVARYRFGAGPDGNVAANTLTLLQNVRPAIERVRNPATASGGTAADRVDDIRRDLSIGLTAFGRIVSQRDLADFVQAVAGVAKVHIARSGGTYVVTYAARPGESVDEDALKDALRANGAGNWSIVLRAARSRRFVLAATLALEPGPLDVVGRARSALRAVFGFDNRAIGEDVTASSVIDLLQNGNGVAAVRLQALHERGAIPSVDERIVARSAADGAPVLFTIDAEALVLHAESFEEPR